MWNEIATAPRDGTLILAYDCRHEVRPDGLEPEIRWSPYEVVRWSIQERSRWIFADNDTMVRDRYDASHWQRSQGSWYPTHWQSLPEPPHLDAEAKKQAVARARTGRKARTEKR